MSARVHFLTASRAFSDPTRVRVLAGLRHGELCVCDLAEVLDVRQSTLSTHLQVLRAAGLVRTRREGRWSHYAIAPGARDTVDALFGAFRASLAGDRALRADARRFQDLREGRGADGCGAAACEAGPDRGRRP